MLRIIADSTCDISKEDARKMGIQIVPISVRFGNEEFLDGVEITHEEFYTRLAECDELPKTSQPSPDTFMKVFNEAVAAGMMYLEYSYLLIYQEHIRVPALLL